MGFFALPSVISRGHGRSAHDRRLGPRWPNAFMPRWLAELAVLACGTGWPRSCPVRVAGAAGLLVMSERLARREVARGHGLAYDRNE